MQSSSRRRIQSKKTCHDSRAALCEGWENSVECLHNLTYGGLRNTGMSISVGVGYIRGCKISSSHSRCFGLAVPTPG